MSRWHRVKTVGVLAVLATTAVAGSVSLASAQCCSLPKDAAASQTPAGRDSVLVLDIAGMTCDGCAAHVKKALSGVKGVKDAKVSFSAKEARVRIAKPTAAEKKLVEAVRKAGYDAHAKAKTPAEEEKSSSEVRKSTSS